MSFAAHSSTLRMKPCMELREALKKALIYHSFVPTRVKVRTVMLHLRNPNEFNVVQIREGIKWLKNRVADADLIIACKKEHVAEHVFDEVTSFMKKYTDDSEHAKLDFLSTKLRVTILRALADAELGGAFLGM